MYCETIVLDDHRRNLLCQIWVCGNAILDMGQCVWQSVDWAAKKSKACCWSANKHRLADVPVFTAVWVNYHNYTGNLHIFNFWIEVPTNFTYQDLTNAPPHQPQSNANTMQLYYFPNQLSFHSQYLHALYFAILFGARAPLGALIAELQYLGISASFGAKLTQKMHNTADLWLKLSN